MAITIALVDDDRNILTSLSVALQSEGFLTRVYSDGETALKALTDNPPDLAVLDVKMPRIDGMELLRRLRERSPAAITLATALVVLVLTKMADRLPDVMRHDFGAVVPAWLLHLQAVFEEPLESTIPLLFLLAIAQARLARAQDLSRRVSAA